MITTHDIKRILDSSEFQKELEELSTYASRMKQERPIVLLLSKHLWKRGFKASPELKKCDLDADGTKIEFKFHYDSDVPKICGEMVGYDSLEAHTQAILKKELHPTWTSTPGIRKDIDVTQKNADIFVQDKLLIRVSLP